MTSRRITDLFLIAAICLLTLTALAQRPSTAKELVAEGNKFGQARQFDKAVEMFRKAVELDPNLASAQRGLGYAYSNLGRYSEALGPLETAVRLEPQVAQSHFFLGANYIGLRKPEEAYASLSEAIRLDPNNAAYHNMMGLWMSNSGRFEDAILSYKRSIEINPNEVVNFLNVGLMYMRMGKFQDAIEPLEKATAMAPMYKKAWFHLGNAYSKTLRFRESAGAWLKVIELDPNDSLAVSNVAWNFLYEGNSHADAVKYAEAYLGRFGWKGESSPYLVLVGVIAHRSMGNHAEADALLLSALKKGNPDVWAFTIIRFMRGEISSDELLRLAVSNDKKTEANTYIGLDLKLKGHEQDAAKYLGWVKEFGNKSFFEYPLALNQLKSLAR